MSFHTSKMSLALCALCLLAGCGKAHEPRRPENVPEGATLAPGGKVGGWWHYCKFSESDQQAHCTIWNAGGLILYEGVFRSHDGEPLESRDLKVVYNPRWGDPAQFICLQNGRLLIPSSDFERLSKFADWMTGKRDSPN